MSMSSLKTEINNIDDEVTSPESKRHPINIRGTNRGGGERTCKSLKCLRNSYKIDKWRIEVVGI